MLALKVPLVPAAAKSKSFGLEVASAGLIATTLVDVLAPARKVPSTGEAAAMPVKSDAVAWLARPHPG